MQIDPVLQSKTSSTETPTKGKEIRDEFLKLLVAQLERQNPLDPQSGAEFVAQLAQFTAVEQSAETNRLLNSIQTEQVQASHLALAGFAGKNAVASASNFQLESRGASVPGLQLELDGAANEVEMVVTNAAGEPVRTIKLGAQDKGTASASWDGTDDKGVPVDPGTYSIKVKATAKDGSTVKASASFSGVIDAVEFHDGVPRLRIGGALVSAGNVISISSGEQHVNMDKLIHGNERLERPRKSD